MKHRSAAGKILRIFLLVFIFAWQPGVSTGEITHIGAPLETKAIEYLQACFARPVFWLVALKELDTAILPMCIANDPKSQQQVVSALDLKGYRIVRSDDILVLTGSKRPPKPNSWDPDSPSWDTAKVTLDLKNYKPPEAQEYESLPLLANQMQSLAQQILKKARMIVLQKPEVDVQPHFISDPKLRGEALHPPSHIPVDLEIVFDRRQLVPNGPESVVAILSERTGGIGRIIYGEMKNGNYEPMWDSTEFYFENDVTLDYSDVDADGKPEILLRTKTRGVRLRNPMLSILDLKGKELTRESRDCSFGASRLEDALCSINASEFSFELDAEGKTVIVAAQDYEGGSEPPREYHWVHGAFTDLNSRARVHRRARH